jgi:hypothetical protein
VPEADGDDLARRMREATLEHLAAVVANTDPGSRSSNAAKAELTRREILTQQSAAKAQEEAARYTRQTARWMFWSVIVVAVSSIIGLAWQILGHH